MEGWGRFGPIVEQNVAGWAVSGYLGDGQRGLSGGVAGRSFELSAGAVMTTKVQKVPKVFRAKGQRSERSHQHSNLNPGSPATVLLLVFTNPPETHTKRDIKHYNIAVSSHVWGMSRGVSTIWTY